MDILPKKLAESVKKGFIGIPWQLDAPPQQKGTVAIIFGRKFGPEKEGNLLVKKYEILIAIRDFYKKYFEEVN